MEFLPPAWWPGAVSFLLYLCFALHPYAFARPPSARVEGLGFLACSPIPPGCLRTEFRQSTKRRLHALVSRLLRITASSLPRGRTSMRAPIYSYERGAIVAFAPLVLLVLPKPLFPLGSDRLRRVRPHIWLRKSLRFVGY